LLASVLNFPLALAVVALLILGPSFSYYSWWKVCRRERRSGCWILNFQLCVILVFSAAILSSWFQNLQICRAFLVLFLAASDLPSFVVFLVFSESFFFVSDIGFLVQLLAVSDLGFLLLFSVVSDQSFCCYSQQLLASESGVYPNSLSVSVSKSISFQLYHVFG
jgi:hypothetical protein